MHHFEWTADTGAAAVAFAGLLVTSIMGIGMYLAAEFIERRTTGWATRGADSPGVRRG